MSKTFNIKKDPFALVVIDLNGDFVGGRYLPNASLAVPGADEVIDPVHNQLFPLLKGSACKGVLFTRDTHFSGEYEKSPEAQAFPNIHCEVGTRGHQLVVDPMEAVKNGQRVHFLNKNVFDTWGEMHTGATEADVPHAQREVYRNLFQITDESGTRAVTSREAFFNNLKNEQGVKTLVVCGVATDYCVLMFVIGALKRGFRVVLLEDMVRHIAHEVDDLMFMEPQDVAKHLNPGTDEASMAQRHKVVRDMHNKPLFEHNLIVTTVGDLPRGERKRYAKAL